MRLIRAAAVVGALALASIGLTGRADAQQPGTTVNSIVIGPNMEITLDASTVSPGALWYDWDFGDGAFLLSGPVVRHTYTLEGSYVVRVNAVTVDRRDVYSTFAVLVDDFRYRNYPFTGPRLVRYDPVTGQPFYPLVSPFFSPSTSMSEFVPASGFPMPQPIYNGIPPR